MTNKPTPKAGTMGKGNPGKKCRHEPSITCDRTDCDTCIQEEERWAEKWTQRSHYEAKII